MQKQLIIAGLAGLLFNGQSATAKTLEDVLKEKEVITEEDYKEVTKSKPLQYLPGKGFTFTSDDEMFRLSLGGRLQTRLTYTDYDGDSSKPNATKAEVRRMKLWLSGNAYSKDLTYLLQTDFTQSGSSKLLEHAYFNYRLQDELQILAGQTKVPFGRQWLNSSGALQFVDRSITSDTFRPGYDTGMKLSGYIMKGLLTYDLGIYGGAGQSTTRTSSENAYAGRVMVNPFGNMAYGESDLDNSAKPLLSIGANFYGNTLKKTTATSFETNNIALAGSSGWLGKGISTFATGERVDISTWGADAAFKWQGVFAEAEYLAGEAEGGRSGKHLRANGFYGQVGYCVIPKKLELALRYSFVEPNKSKSNDLIRDTSGAVSWYFDKHNLKLQGDVTNSNDESKGDTDDLIYRLQAQITF